MSGAETWGSVRAGDMYFIPQDGDDPEYSERTYTVLSTEDRPHALRVVTVLYSSGETAVWTGQRGDEFYGDVLLSRLKNTGE